MERRSPAEAVAEFTRVLQAVIDCLTPAVFSVSKGGYHPSGQPHAAALQDLEPVMLASEPRLYLDAACWYRIVDGDGRGAWQVRLEGYANTIRDERLAPLLAYHWHPGGGSRVDWPHLHIYAPLAQDSAKLQKAHLPTGPISLAAVVRMLITELGVAPRRGREHWESVLEASRPAFDALWPQR